MVLFFSCTKENDTESVFIGDFKASGACSYLEPVEAEFSITYNPSKKHYTLFSESYGIYWAYNQILLLENGILTDGDKAVFDHADYTITIVDNNTLRLKYVESARTFCDLLLKRI
jgi:hypothetical protein